MHIDDLLEKLVIGSDFTAGIASFDIINSSRLQGTDENISKTKDALKDLLESLFGDLPVAILSWRGDGGLVIADASKGMDDLIIICDKLIGLIPFFNHSRGSLNLLDNDEIHLRVVCHTGFIKNTGHPETIHSESVNSLVKSEREVGIKDHVVITEEVKRRISKHLQNRLTTSDNVNEKLGNCYTLDRPQTASTIQLNQRTSESLLFWIRRSLEQAKYDELYIISYTNESLAPNLPTLPHVKIKILARNWMTETKEENAYHEEIRKTVDQKAPPRLWVKSEIIYSMANILVGPDYQPHSQSEIDIRFYDTPPMLKGAILRNSRTGERAAHIGFYKWEPDREEGGSPYVGKHWSGFWLQDDGGPQSIMLDSIKTRFDQLWKTGYDFKRLVELEGKFAQESNIQNVWNLDGMSYLLVVPGRSDGGRIYPTVASEDLFAMRVVENLLLEIGATVEILIDTNTKIIERIQDWQGHLVLFCHLSLDDELLNELYEQGCPYTINRDSNSNLSISHKKHKQTFFSPMDEDPPSKRDYSLVVKASRSNGLSKLFILAGIHAMGTLGGALYLTNPKHTKLIWDRVEDENFATLVQCEFEGPWKVKNVEDVMVPETF